MIKLLLHGKLELKSRSSFSTAQDCRWQSHFKKHYVYMYIHPFIHRLPFIPFQGRRGAGANPNNL